MKITYDPLNKYESSKNDIRGAVGILPYWLFEVDHEEKEDVIDHLTKLYGFGRLYEMKCHTIDKDFTYKYPEDPDMAPLMVIDSEYTSAVIYPYSMIAIRFADGTHFVTRLD